MVFYKRHTTAINSFRHMGLVILMMDGLLWQLRLGIALELVMQYD